MFKKRSIFTFGLCFALFAGLLFSNVILAQDGGTYDPWIDTNDDGIVDAIDLQALAAIYGTSGTPINKTELLLELEARLNSLNASLLNDYYTIDECNSLFALIGHLHSGYDVRGGILGVDMIQLGTTEDDRFIYFYDDGFAEGEYLYWENAGDQFWLSDDIGIEGAITIDPTTRYYSIPATAWLPYRDDYTIYRTYAGLYTTTAGTTQWRATVNLPHGSVVTGLRALIYDNSTYDIEIRLIEQIAGSQGYYILANVTSEGALDSYREFYDFTIQNPIVDNEYCAYLLVGDLVSGDNNHRLGQVRITYTIDEPLP